MRRRRIQTRDAGDLVDEFLAVARERIDLRFAPVAQRSPSLSARLDQIECSLRDRFAECGIPLSDDVVRAALLIVADTLVASHGRLSLACPHSWPFWEVTAQFALAVRQIEDHEGARP